MNQQKRKELHSDKPKKHTKELQEPQRSKSTQDGFQINWDDEIAALSIQKFESLDEAVEAIADSVLMKMFGNEGKQDSETKVFLLNLLRANEEVCRVIEESLLK